jgi:peptidoglycan/LPS O-acetylase OafA/YrhL
MLMQTRFRILDGWRGLCALWVALFHLGPLGPILSLPFFRNSYLFVDFFFVLSGFVITHTYAHRLNSTADILGFIIRRIGRLWPLHAFVISLLIIDQAILFIVYPQNHPLHNSAFTGLFNLAALPATLLLLQSLGIYAYTPWNAPSWSISTELWVYLIFISLIWIGPRLKILSVLLLAISGAMIVSWYSPHAMNTTYDYGFFRCLYGFFTGYLFLKLHSRIQSLGNYGKVLEILVIILVVVFISYTREQRWSLLAPLIFGCAVLIFAYEDGSVSAWMQNKFLVSLGSWSYSIYLMHWPILLIINQYIPDLNNQVRLWLHSSNQHEFEFTTFLLKYLIECVIAVLYLSLVIVCSRLTFHCIEQPNRMRFNKWAHAWEWKSSSVEIAQNLEVDFPASHFRE